ncbi:peptidoglycan/LPS O-acetylase OafA/YrhL [Amycolatopsis bartoniae]|uniref:Acyltransferase n=1 Tax=Amycolatopsis bartoniae TaxID=941986 RepID=A0A8H9J0C6_9PSEU|nr:acyltransferase family protein [Amycolatopsis bartoniae]MBB2933313.1 peptidoglycan/LPS O-acetylase OafA/YrhL [Amycolatopsis bartoniae]TVT08079.1 acyltransferase [Amycolatopsis bartoniae]GHF58623.1 acyltransferase [Amycolatopsis bartoniae]
MLNSCTKVHANPHVGFAWLRTVGALLIVLDHCWALLFSDRSTILPPSWHVAPGYVALMGLFAMSGYQIQHSWSRDPSWWRFAARRLLRILPPLALVVSVTVLVVGPLVTVWPQADYWTSAQTWRYLVGTCLVMLLQHRLPGVFDSLPYPYSANGSLWTLPMELLGYGLVLVVGVLVALGASRLVLLLLLAAMVFADVVLGASFESQGEVSVLNIPLGSTVSFLVPFVLGMVLHAFRHRIPFRPSVAAVLFVAWVAVCRTEWNRYVLPLMAAYGAVTLARHWPQRLGGVGPFVLGSYGISIWGFLVQQLIILAGVRDPWVLAVLSLPAAYLAGQLSWRFVEEPTLRLRRYLKPRRAAVRAEPVVSSVAEPLAVPIAPGRDVA